METPQNYQDVLARVDTFTKEAKEAQATKEAGATKVPEQDDRDKGIKGIPSGDDVDDTKRCQNDKSNEDTKLEDESTHPVSTGKNVPSTQDGNAKEDAFTDPTTPLSKIADFSDRVNAITARMSNFTGGGEGGQVTPAKEAGEGESTTAEKTETPDAKEANTELANDYSDDYLRKLAYAIVETEGGLEAVEPILLKFAGQEEAKEIMYKAAAEYDGLVQLSDAIQEEEMLKAAYEQEVISQAEEMLKSASEEEREIIIKIATTHDEACADYGDEELLKIAYMAGAGDGAAMMDAEAAAGEGEEAGLPGAAQGEPSVEEIVQLLDAMVASGEIDEETAAEVVAQLAGGGEEEAMMEGAMPEEAMMAEAGGGMPEEAGMVAQASADALCAKLIQTPS